MLTRIMTNAERHSNSRTLCKQGSVKEALHSLNLMMHQGIPIPPDTYACILQSCTNHKFLPKGKFVHSHIIQSGIIPNIFLGNTLLIMYTKCGTLSDSRRVLDQMALRNVVTWTAMISAYAKHGLSEEALMLFNQMKRTGIQPNQHTFVAVLSACACLSALQLGKEIHEDIEAMGFEQNVYLTNALLDMYVKCGRVEDARHVFDRTPQRDVVLWNAMVAGYAQAGMVDEAFKLFDEMPVRDVVSWTAMIAGYAQSGKMDDALKLFDQMLQKNVVSLNAMLAVYARNGQIEEAMELFDKMPERNVVSWTTMIAGFTLNGAVDEAFRLFKNMPERDVVSWNAMISGYVQNGHVDKALSLFQEMPERNVTSWNAMVAGYTQNGYYQESLIIFQQMQERRVKPNSETFAAVLPACANLAAVERGKEIHEYIIRSRLQSDVFVGNALIDMYAKCGNIVNAIKIFDKMPRRNAVSWTTLIAGYAMHGFGKEALQCFEQMQKSGTKPDHVTFVSVLSACCHAGLVYDGCWYFNCMSKDYHILPIMEHYCCMVDLLCRAGFLDETQNFINKMPMKPDATVWVSMLAACRMYNNIDLGEYAAKRLLELEPNDATPYVLQSNMYAAAGRWDEIGYVRKIMKNQRVEKKPGCSWIEVNKQLYTFLVEDR